MSNFGKRSFFRRHLKVHFGKLSISDQGEPHENLEVLLRVANLLITRFRSSSKTCERLSDLESLLKLTESLLDRGLDDASSSKKQAGSTNLFQPKRVGNRALLYIS